MHGTEIYGIVRQARPDSSPEQIAPDTFVRNALLTLDEDETDRLWEPVRAAPTTRGIAEDHTAFTVELRRTFDGIDRR